MLKPAILFKDELIKLHTIAVTDDYYMFYNGCSYKDYRFEVCNDEWNTIQRVSVDNAGKVIGYMSADMDRYAKNCRYFGLMNFTKQSNLIFSKDILMFLRELRDKFKANKFEFMAYVGGPAEKMYSKFIKKHGGSVVGIQHQYCILSDGEYYDLKLFEILRKDMNF